MNSVSFADSDSLRTVFYTTRVTEEKWAAAYLIAKENISSHPDTVTKYMYAVIKDSAANPQSESLGNCFHSLGVYHFYQHHFDSVIFYSSKALKIFLDNGNLDRGMKAQYNIALAHRSLGDYQSALNNLYEILDFRKNDSDSVRVAATLNDIGNTYSYLKDYTKAILFQNEALEYLEETPDIGIQGNVYNSLGYIYQKIGKPDSAILFYQQSLELKLQAGNIYSVVNTRNNLCILIDYKQYPEKCEECLKELLRDQKKINDTKGIARTFINLSVQNVYYGNCSKALSQLDSVGYYLRFSNDIFLKQYYFDYYADALKKCGEINLAYLYLDSLITLNDSIFKFQKQKEIIELDTKYQTQQKEANIKALKAANAISLLNVEKQRWQISFLVFFLITLIGGGVLFFFLLKQRQRKLKELAVLKMREEERVRIARDMHDEIGSGLTRISFMSEQIRMQKDADENKEGVSKIISQSRNLSKNLREIIWAIDPRNDKLSELMFYFRDYINEFSENTDINCIVDFSEVKEDVEILSEIRRNLFLALKEILNNIAKHADTDLVKVEFHIEGKFAYLRVTDNGKGFDEEIVKKGLGLESLKNRTEKLGGVFRLESKINIGTTIMIEKIRLNTTKV